MASTAALELLIKMKGQSEASKGFADMAKNALSFAAGGIIQKGIETVAGSIGGILTDSLQEAKDAQRGIAQLDAVLKSTGGSAGVTKDQVLGLADSLSSAGGLSTATDDAVLQGENMLLTFTNIGKDVFPKATQTMLDMATGMNNGVTPSAEELSKQAIQLGKALNDPTAGLTALRKVGVAFTNEQKDQIKTLQSNGDMMGAQKIILDELAKEFGGSAQAAAETFDGKMAHLGGVMDNVKQAIGERLIPILDGLVTHVSDFLTAVTSGDSDKVKQFFNDLGGGPDSIVGKVGGTLVDAATKVGGFFTAVTSGDPDKVKQFFSDLGGGPDSLIGVIGSTLVDVAGKVGAFFTALTSGDANAVKTYFTDLGGPIGAIGGFLTDAVTKAGEFFTALTSSDPEAIKTFFTELGGGADSLIGKVGAALGDAKTGLIDLFAAMTGGGSADAKQFWIDLEGVVSRIKQSWDDFWAPQSSRTIKNKEEWHDLQINGDPTQNGFGANWNTFWTTITTALGTFKDGWDTFWTSTRTALGISQTDWDNFWGGQKTGQDDMKTRADGFYFEEFDNNNAMKRNWDNFWLTTNTSFGGFAKGWTDFWTNVGIALGTFALDWSTFWANVQKKVAEWKQAWDEFWSSVATGLNNITGAWDKFWSDLWGNVSKLTSGSSTIGSDLIAGVKTGITNAWASFTSWLTGMFTDALQSVKNALGIHSPSQVMADEVGKPMVLGVKTGIEQAWPEFMTDYERRWMLSLEMWKVLAVGQIAVGLKAAQSLRQGFVDEWDTTAAGQITTAISETWGVIGTQAGINMLDVGHTAAHSLSLGVLDGQAELMAAMQAIWDGAWGYANERAQQIRDLYQHYNNPQGSGVGQGDTAGGGGGSGGGNPREMAAGGIVTRRTLAYVGEAGPEAVIPLSRMGSMGGLTINNLTIQAGPGTDGALVAQRFVEGLEQELGLSVRIATGQGRR